MLHSGVYSKSLTPVNLQSKDNYLTKRSQYGQRQRVLEITRHCQTTTGTLPHIDIQSSQQLGQNVDGVVDIVVEVRSGVARVVSGVEEEVGEELEQLLG